MYKAERRARERIVDFEVRRLERRQTLERALPIRTTVPALGRRRLARAGASPAKRHG